MTEEVTIEELRSIQKYMHDNRQTSTDNTANYHELDEHINDLINVINKIDRENYRLQPTIIEQAIMDFINSNVDGRASLEAIVNACKSRDDSFLTIHFVTATVDRLRAEDKLELLWFSNDDAYTYKVASEP